MKLSVRALVRLRTEDRIVEVGEVVELDKETATLLLQSKKVQRLKIKKEVEDGN